ncbi:metal-dependent hydrolase [Actinoplanes lobatus]|uniref:Branched-chain amino acid transport system permease protein n=1 Tax=Actinoplanes lobatus TaxID=113568 RepID=A0A7W7HKK6_9ACTN|nr:branched-chain amino acid ABC transporter ATP-binding protein/permease [Actinoplanes lobatus]MBB4752271.1 branched-chain amino acid transport system permease protein [Actinoplanes lobatus]GGN94122.1 metal-dependent hydrolase [Actinoplanes lobatus]GIE45744.1 metal-dependent hydrolase [Actinoplanes lobatus]
MRTRIITAAAAGVVAWLLPYGLDSYAIHVVDVILIFAVLAVGLGLCMGVGGQVNLAQIAFFGVGAYATAILTTKSGLGFWTSAALAIAATVIVGLVVGTPALRVQSHYLGIVTLGLALAFTNWVTNAELSGGAEGISNIPVPQLPGVDLSSEYLYYYLELIVFAASLGFGLFVVHTGLGRRLRAMRDDALAASALGAEVPMLRMVAFLLASVYGGLAGVLYAGLIRYVAPESFGIANMFLLLGMVIIGGRQSLIGCVVGAVGLFLVRELLVDHPTIAQIGYGSVVVLVVVFAPTGLAGLPARIRAVIDRRRGRQDAAAQLQPFQPYDHTGSPATEATELLHVAAVSKDFRGLKALDDVSLTVTTGEIRGIVGPNGSGKTTLFNVISGFYRPTRGRVTVAGRDLTGRAPYRLARAGIARTFQNLRLFGDLTVEENLLVALDRTGTVQSWRYLLRPFHVLRRDRDLHGQARHILDRYGLTEFAARPPKSLPYGIQRRVEIARAVAAAPTLLLLDEPAAGLNGEEVRQLREIVRSIRDSGITVIIIEHNMGLVMSLCEQVTVLAGGRVIAEGTPAQVAATPAVIEAYLGDSMDTDDLPTIPEATR